MTDNPLYLQGEHTCPKCDANLRQGDSDYIAVCPVCRYEAASDDTE